MSSSDQLLQQHFGTIWPVHVEHFTQLLIVLRQGFDGDLDLMLILAIIGSRSLPSRRNQPFTLDDFMTSSLGQRHPDPINLQSIAECSGIPRETVRRKLTQLEQRSWISKNAQGHYFVNPTASSELADMTQASLNYLQAVFGALDAVR